MTQDTESRIPLQDLLVFHQLARSLTSSFDLDAILRTILEQMEQFIQAELWTLLMLDPETQELHYAIAAGGQEELRQSDVVLRGLSKAWGILEHSRFKRIRLCNIASPEHFC